MKYKMVYDEIGEDETEKKRKDKRGQNGRKED